MMKPIKLAGRELMLGSGCLEHLKTLKGEKALIVIGSSSMEKSGVLQRVEDYLKDAGISSEVLSGIESDPLFSTVLKGAEVMKMCGSDIIIALGGGSVIDATKAMRIYYEYPELTTLQEILPPNTVPKLGSKSILVCIPTTSGSASEVTRAMVIKNDITHIKRGIVSTELMPDITICDPVVTVTMTPRITAETGMDALTHALEAIVSNKANYISNILALAAAKDIILNLPKAYKDGANIEYREIMMNASMTAGMAFTNSSLGIVHSMAHTLGSIFGVTHGLANAVLLPYIIEFNCSDKVVRNNYTNLEKALDAGSLISVVEKLNRYLGIPGCFCEIIADETLYMEELDDMVKIALKDGCTLGNPVTPTVGDFKALFVKVYKG